MHRINSRIEGFNPRSFAAMLGVVLSTLLVAASARVCVAQASTQKTFKSAREASHALFQAIQKGDEPAIMVILGATKKLVCCGDAGQDKVERDQFTRKYQEMHRLVREPDGTTVLYIGAENWPFPIPLVSKEGTWRFDAKAGDQEVLYRRIGENEEAVIQACQQLVQDQTDHKTASGSIPAPYHGYYFRSLASQGKPAPGGAKNALYNGKTTGVIAFVAYPAEYRSSGVLTFIVNQDGMVYAKDLGPNTTKRAKAISGSISISTWGVAN